MITRRRFLATTVAAAAIVPRASLGQTMRKVKMGTAFTTTTNAAFLMPKSRSRFRNSILGQYLQKSRT